MKISFTKTQIGILEVLSDRWYQQLNVSEISIASGLSQSSVYESITGLKDRAAVIVSNGRYRINFSNDLAWAIKRLNDASKLYSLPEHIKDKIIEIKEKATLFFGFDLLSVLVFGSSASFEFSKESDIDFFIVLKRKKAGSGFLNFLTAEDKNFNIIQNDMDEFQEGLDKGDDFIISVLKNHILLQGDDYFRFFLKNDLPKVSSQIIHEREVQLNKLKNKIDNLIIDEQPIAYEKIREYIKLKVRLLLMKSNTVPTSNKNLFDLMKKQFPKYYRTYNKITRSNIKSTYINLLKE